MMRSNFWPFLGNLWDDFVVAQLALLAVESDTLVGWRHWRGLRPKINVFPTDCSIREVLQDVYSVAVCYSIENAVSLYN